MANARAALSGITVLDLSTGFAAALSSMFLADNGARVIRLVSRDEDILREPDIFALYDRGKEVARLDSGADARTIYEMCERADVILDDFQPSSVTRGQLGLDNLAKRLPRLVHCSITAYGTRGPYRNQPADHDLVAARCGILGNQPSYRGGPIHVAHPVAYVGAGLLATLGIIAALFQREKTGRGRRVETSLMAGALLYTPKAVSENLPARGLGMSPQGGGPFYSVFECSDGKWIQLGCIHSGFVDLASAVLGIADKIASDPKYGDGRWPRDEGVRKELFGLVADTIRTRPSAEWLEELQAADVPCDLSQTAEDAMANPQIIHGGLVQELDDPALGPVRMAGIPIRLSRTPGCSCKARPVSYDNGVTHESEPASDGAVHDSGTSADLPLEGVRILEMTNVIAGPVAGRLLADLGADMIKFESLDGDISRPAGGAGFVAFNANKRSVSANTRTEEGKKVAQRIAASSDAILANMRPGATDRMGLDDETLKELNPELVQMHVTAYGWDGPYAHRPGLDPIAQAITGLQHAQGGYDGPPVYLSSLAPCDYTTGALGALGAALGLLARQRHGIAQKVDTSLLAAGTLQNADGFLQYEGKKPRLLPDRDQFGLGPLRRLYKASDGWIYLAADAPEMTSRLERAISDLTGTSNGNDSLSTDNLESIFGGMAVEDALKVLRSHDVPCSPVTEGYGTRFFDDPQAIENEMATELQHPKLGTLKLSGNLITFDGMSTMSKRPTPLLGEHTYEVLSEVGYTAHQIEDLYQKGVVKTETPE